MRWIVLALLLVPATARAELTPEQVAKLAFLADHMVAAGETATLPSGAAAPEVWLDGVNLRVTNGRGHTNIETPADANGLGNIFTGYGEPLAADRAANGLGPVVRTGVHGIAGGRGNDWGPTAYAWFDYGKLSDCYGPYCAILGLNQRAYDYGTCLGGANNVCGTPDAEGENSLYATVVGGTQSSATGYAATVCGGAQNMAPGVFGTVSGGDMNSATGDYATATGGVGNIASGSSASVTGGVNNHATGVFATVSGGSAHTQSSTSGWTGGSYHTP